MGKIKRVNLIGNFGIGLAGEKADEILIAEALSTLGYQVLRIGRDVWKAHLDRKMSLPQWGDLTQIPADINIICKWHHFQDGRYIKELKERTKAPVFYWCWDWMFRDGVAPDWHLLMAKEADVYLSNEFGFKEQIEKHGIHFYYLPYDTADDKIKRAWALAQEPRHDVVFTGSWYDYGRTKRTAVLEEIARRRKIIFFASNAEEWRKRGFEAYEARFGEKLAKLVANTKILLDISVTDDCYGYWSNRCGKILTLGGFLLVHYIEGMELFLRDGVAYWNSVEDCIEKIDYFLKNKEEREKIAQRGYEIGRQRFTTIERCKDLMIFAENYLGRQLWV